MYVLKLWHLRLKFAKLLRITFGRKSGIPHCLLHSTIYRSLVVNFSCNVVDMIKSNFSLHVENCRTDTLDLVVIERMHPVDTG